MKVSETPGSLKRFRRTSWRFQQTFQTPLKNLAPFVAEIVSALRPIQAANVTIDQIVFEPRNLMALLAESSIEVKLTRDFSLEATGEAEIEDLLRAALSDCVNFIFVPTPRRIAVYVDHDEYATFFSITKSHLNHVARALKEKGFQQVDDYQRRL